MATSHAQQQRVAIIDFFGHGAADMTETRKSLPFREGDAFPSEGPQGWKQAVRDRVPRVTDVAMVCCHEGGWMIYIGVAGASVTNAQHNPAPSGSARLPAEMMRLDSELDAAWVDAVGRGAVAEDHSTGYSLSKDPALRAKQMELRRLALRHEKQIFRVAAESSDRAHRAAAAFALGYVRQGRNQVRALVTASRDPDSEVRNNAARSLGVLVRARADLCKAIPASLFIDMLRSGQWTDRNKGSGLLLGLTGDRDPAMLAELRAHALEALIEIARWRSPGHAYAARILLGRIAGIDEARLEKLIETGLDEIVSAARRLN